MTWLWKLLGNLFILTMMLHTARSLKDEINKESSGENTTAYRLPDNIIPSTYYLRLEPFIANDNFTFHGSVQIIANVTKQTSKIVLHVEKLKIRNVTVASSNGNNALTKVGVKNVTEQEKYQFLNIELDRPIDANSNITIAISFSGKVNDAAEGLFKNSYTVNNKTRWILSTQNEPTGARKVFPCFDEPAMRAVFQINVVAPKNYTVISNMPLKLITKGQVYEFEKTPPMSSYLVTIVVSDFKNLTVLDGNRTYRVWSQMELVYELPYSLAVIPQALKFFETKLGVRYPLSKVDIVAIPDFSSEAMENWGLQIYSEMLMLFDARTTPLSLKRYIRNLITHEHAHQWFGNLVTPKWWEYLWLSEGFAQYFQFFAHEDELSSWNLESDFVVDVMHEGLNFDAAEDTHPITNKVYSPSQIEGMFDTISYNKAGCIVRMLEKVLGPDIFYGALRRYMQKNKYSTATPELLIEAFEEEIKAKNYKLHASMSEIVNTWTLQPGFPVVNVQFNGDTVAIKQKRFFVHQPKNTTFNTAWCIPINWATQSKPDFNDTTKLIWVRDNFTTLPIENASKDWVIFNVQQTGFYRVNYDNQMWKRIINALRSNDFEKIHEINRASLIDDLFNLARVGEVDYETVFNATQYLKKEFNYVPWKAAFNGFFYLSVRLDVNSEVYNHLKVYIKSLLEPIYQKLGFDERNNESHFDTLLRQNVLEWLCKLDHQDCVNKAWDAFNNLQQNKTSEISPNQQGFVYCTVIKHGSMKEYNYLWQKFNKSILSSERNTILTALTCSQNSSIIENLFNDVTSVENGIKQEQMSNLLYSIVKNREVGLPTVLNYMENRFDDIMENFGDEYETNNLIRLVSEQLASDDQINKLTAVLKNNHAKLSSVLKSIEHSLENTMSDLNRFKNYSPKILNWIKNHK